MFHHAWSHSWFARQKCSCNNLRRRHTALAETPVVDFTQLPKHQPTRRAIAAEPYGMAEGNQRLMYKSLQKRVRHLHSVYVRNLTCVTSDVSSLQSYFSLHKNRRSPAFYKSEVVGATRNPSWESFDLTGLDLDPACICSNDVTIRVWCCMKERPEFVVQVLWDVDLRALVYYGDKVDEACLADTPAALVLGLWSGYFGAPASGNAAATASPGASPGASAAGSLPGPSAAPPSAVSGQQTDPAAATATSEARPWRLPASSEASNRKLSYSASLLTRLQTILRALKQTRASVDRVRKSIHTKLRSAEMQASKSSEIEAVELRCRQLRLQVARERQYVLERRRAVLALDLAKEELANATSQKAEQVKNEAGRADALRTSLRNNRSRLRSTRLLVDVRSKELAAELSYIYPIEKVADDKFTIAGVCLPNSEDFQGHSDTDLAVGLGCVAHVVHTLSRFLDIPLQFPLACRSSRSVVVYHIIDRPSLRDGEFPLFSKGKDKVAYSYAVFLLNKNVAQLRCALGMPTSDLRMTLPNLHSFLRDKLRVPTTWREPLTRPIDVSSAARPNDAEESSDNGGSDRNVAVSGGNGGSEARLAGDDAAVDTRHSSPAAASVAADAATPSGMAGSYSTDDDDACSRHLVDGATMAASVDLLGPAGGCPQDGLRHHDDAPGSAVLVDGLQSPAQFSRAEPASETSACASLSPAGQHDVKRASAGHVRSRRSSCRHAVLLLDDGSDGQASDDDSDTTASGNSQLRPATSALWLPVSNGDSSPANAAGYSEAIS